MLVGYGRTSTIEQEAGLTPVAVGGEYANGGHGVALLQTSRVLLTGAIVDEPTNPHLGVGSVSSGEDASAFVLAVHGGVTSAERHTVALGVKGIAVVIHHRHDGGGTLAQKRAKSVLIGDHRQRRVGCVWTLLRTRTLLQDKIPSGGRSQIGEHPPVG